MVVVIEVVFVLVVVVAVTGVISSGSFVSEVALTSSSFSLSLLLMVVDGEIATLIEC